VRAPDARSALNPDKGEVGVRRSIPILLTIVAMLIAAPTVHAGNIQLESVTVGPQASNFNELVQIPKFDPNTGVLTMVTVRISSSLEATILAENLMNKPGNVTAMSTQTISVDPPDFIAPLVDDTAEIPETTQRVAPFDGIGPVNGADTVSFELEPNNPQVTMLLDQSFMMDLGDFQGVGETLDFAVTATSFWRVMSSELATILTKANLLASATIEVEYKYIPEPASISLLGLGSLLILRRRRRRAV